MIPARPETRENASFAITVDFVRGEGDPSRPFRTMTSLMKSLSRFDRDLVKSVDIAIEPILLLEDVEAGSIKAWVATVLRSSDDDAIRSGDWKRVVGDYLVKGKYVLLEKLEGARSISEPKLLDDIQLALLQEAERTGGQTLLGYTAMSRAEIAAHVADVTESLEYLIEGDSATYESRDGEPVPFNVGLRVNEVELDELLTVRTITNHAQMILKIKKPDFLGASMWEFNYEGHPLQASVVDREWLTAFHKNGLGVRPGAALRADVELQTPYDDANDALPTRYLVVKVHEVIPPEPPPDQLKLLTSPDSVDI